MTESNEVNVASEEKCKPLTTEERGWKRRIRRKDEKVKRKFGEWIKMKKKKVGNIGEGRKKRKEDKWRIKSERETGGKEIIVVVVVVEEEKLKERKKEINKERKWNSNHNKCIHRRKRIKIMRRRRLQQKKKDLEEEREKRKMTTDKKKM